MASARTLLLHRWQDTVEEGAGWRRGHWVSELRGRGEFKRPALLHMYVTKREGSLSWEPLCHATDQRREREFASERRISPQVPRRAARRGVPVQQVWKVHHCSPSRVFNVIMGTWCERSVSFSRITVRRCHNALKATKEFVESKLLSCSSVRFVNAFIFNFPKMIKIKHLSNFD